MGIVTDTTNASNKQARFTPDLPTKPITTALANACFAAPMYLALLPLTIKTLTQDYLTKLHKLHATQAKLSNNDYIPTSIHFKFNLRGSDKTKELEDFSKLTNNCDTHIRHCQMALVCKMQNANQLKIELTATEVSICYARATHTLTKTLYIYDLIANGFLLSYCVY